MDSILEELALQAHVPVWVLVLVLVWTLVWKGIALWKSARKSHTIWFILFLVVQTVGIFEILYVYIFSEIKLDEKKPKRKGKKSRSYAN